MYSNSYQKYLEQKEKNKSSQNLSDTLQQFRERAIADYSAQQQLEEESVARGRAMVEAQKARDTINQAANNTAATYDFAHGQLPSISTAQAFQNAQRQTSLDDSLNQIMGNNVLTDAGRVSKAQEAFGSLLSAPTVGSTPTAREVANAYRQSYANINTPIQKAAQAVEAYKPEREQQNLAYNREIGTERRIGQLEREIAKARDSATANANERIPILSEQLMNEPDPQKQAAINHAIKELGTGQTARVKELQAQLNEARRARYATMPYNSNFAANSGFDEKNASVIDKRINGIKPAEYEPLSDEADKYLDFVTDTERGTYNYLRNTKGQAEADKYLDFLRPELEARRMGDVSKKAQRFGYEHPLIGDIATVLGSPYKNAGTVGAIGTALSGGNVRENAVYNLPSVISSAVRSGANERNQADITAALTPAYEWTLKKFGVDESEAAQRAGKAAENTSKVLTFLKTGTLSHLDSLWNAFIAQNLIGNMGGMGFNNARELLAFNQSAPGLVDPNSVSRAQKIVDGAEDLTRIIMGMEAVPDVIRMGKERGLEDDQAFVLGMIAGFAEYSSEKWSVGNLFESDWTKPTIMQVLQQGGFEALEEVQSGIMNEVADLLIAQDKSELKQAVQKYKNNGKDEKTAFALALGERALETGKDALSAFLTTGVSTGITGAYQRSQNPQTIHNKVSSADRKSGGNVGATVDGMLAELINRPETEWASGLADIANQFRGTVRGNTMNAVRDYIRETARNQANAVDNGAYTAIADYLTPYTDQNGKKVDNRNAVWQLAEERNGTAKQTAQNTQTETAPSTESTTPSTAPSTETAEPSTAPSTESTTPQIQATNAENQAITAENQATTQQTAQNVSQTSENAPVAENAVETENNTVTENEAQRGSTEATEGSSQNEPGYRPSEQRIGATALSLSEDLSPEDAAVEILKRIGRNTRDVTSLMQRGVTKTAIDALNRTVDNAIQNGQYTAEEASALKSYADKVRDALRNNNTTLQKKVNALSAGLKRLGIENVVVDETMTTERGKHKGNTIYISPYLDTMQSIASVVAHEAFHQARQGNRKNVKLLDDIDKYYSALASRAQDEVDDEGNVRTDANGNPIQFSISNTGGKVRLYSDADFVRTYADMLMDDFGLTDEGYEALNAYGAEHKDADIKEAVAAVFESDPEKFWSYWKESADGETARDYIREEKAANFIEQLAGTDGGALFGELLRDDRNLAQRIVDMIRSFLRLPPKERRFSETEAYQKLVDKFEKALADASGEEVQRADATPATANDIPQSDSFKMARTVERVGDLIAVHNLTEDKYLSSHKLGGFPAPSIAVVKAKTGHSDYGDISVVFSSDTIDPQKDSRNKIFGGDAWTPMFPETEYDYDKTGIQNLDAAIHKLASSLKVPGVDSRNAVEQVINDSKRWSDTSIDSVVRILSANRTVQAAYLAANGGTLKAKNHFDAYDELDKKVPEISDVAKWIRPAVEFISDNGSVTVSGKRVPLTAENVVRAMYDNQGSRGVDIYEADANGLRSMAAPEFRSIDEVRQNKNLLERLPEQEYRKIINRMDGYIGSIMDEMREFNGDRPGLDYDGAILNALREGGTEEDIRYTFEEAGIGINDKLVRDVGVLYRLASQLPTDYFEAKPERVVGFDEVMYYVVPDQVSEDVLRMMEGDGAGIRTYVTGNDKDRIKALNSLKDARFSREMGDIEQRVEDGEAISAVDEVRASRELDEKYMEKAVDVNRRTDEDKPVQFVDEAVMEQAGKDRATIKAALEEAAKKVHLPDDITGNTYIANGSYNGTEENTTICIRSLALDALCDAVAEKIGRPLTVEESVFVSQSAFNWTQMPQCMYCYVSMDRMAKRQYLLAYIEKRNQVIADLRSGMTRDEAFAAYKKREQPKGKWKDDGPKTDRFNRWVDNYENKARVVSMSDLASEKAAERALADPVIHDEAYDALDYAQHASWAKKRIGYTAYNNHILNWKQDRIDALNSMFGLRMYSFSDYSPAFVLENMQMITDAAVRGLKMLAYTKDLDFVKIFAPTGMNINISVFSMNQRDTKGDFAEDAMQGAKWKEAQALRDQYPGVGITYVATNDEQVEWALDQDWIDVIIPFHMVKTGAEVAGIMGYNNYTGESSDRTKKGNKKAEILPNEHQNDKETYMNLIRERNLKPRFSRWQNHPNYMKLVNETRRSAGDTPSVQPVFEVGEAEKSIDKMVRQGGYNVPIGGSLERMNQIAQNIGGKIEKGFAENISIKDGIIYQNGQAIHPDMELPDTEEDDVRESREINSEQTETEAFRNWFGDSKVVDDNGDPLVVHHGTTADFTQFRPQRRATGSHPYYYFSENSEYPKRFMKAWGNADTAKYMDVYLSISNPLDLSGQKKPIPEWKTILSDAGVNLDEGYFDSVREGYGDSVYGWQLFRSDDGTFQNTVRDAGYDGIKTTESSGDTTWVAFDPTQIKSATDNIGTFDPNNPDIRYSREITPEQDAEYMDAVESGDTEKQQQMVDDAAKEAGYDIKAYHGTGNNFTVFDSKRVGKNYNGYSKYGKGFYFSSSREAADNWGKNRKVLDVYLKLENPYVLPSIVTEGVLFDEYNNMLAKQKKPPVEAVEAPYMISILNQQKNDSGYTTKVLQKNGYDGIVVEYREAQTEGTRSALSGTKEYVVFDESGIKSADPVTYDNDGNPIPLSERFNSENEDIRYSREVGGDLDAEIDSAQAITSAKTSIKQIPALFKNSNVKFGKTNVDIGGGRFDLATNYLREQGTENYIFDPFNRSDEENTRTLDLIRNGGADTATCANVLNVIAEPGARQNVILETAKSIKPDGTAYFMVYEGDGSGVGKETSSGWQNNRKTADYVDEISEYFDDVERKGKLIIAKDPKANLPKANWETSPGNSVRFSRALYNDMYSGEYLDYDRSELGAKLWEQIDSLDEAWDLHERELDDTTNAFLTDLRNSLDDMATANTQSELWRAYIHFKREYGFIEDDYFHDELRADVGRSLDLEEIENIYNARMKQMADEDNPNNYDMRFSREIDNEYMDAVESGDEETQNRIIDEAAKVAGYSRKVYHGGADVTVFDTDRGADGVTELGAGTYVTNSRYYASEWAEEREGKVTNLYLKDGVYFEGDGGVPDSPQWEELKTILKDRYGFTDKDIRIVQEWGMERLVPMLNKNGQRVRGIFQNADIANDLIRAAGYDGIHASFYDGEQWCVFNPQDLKSADPITYDDDGNVIPPSKRFNPERNDIRESRDIETASNADLRRMLRESEEKIDYLKKQWTARTAFGAAQAVRPEDFNKQVRRLKDMMKYSVVTTDEIRKGLRELYDIMERPLKGRSDTAEARWNEAAAKAEELANEWASAAAIERVINPDIAENFETLKDIYAKLRGYSGFYVVPEMTAEAGDKESFRKLRRQLAFMHLLGVDSNKAGVESGRMSIDAIYTDLARSYPGFFNEQTELSGGELNGDYAKLQAIADVAGLAWEAAHDPYSVEQTLDEQTVKTQLKDDLLHSFFDVAVPTKASSRPTENDAREAYAQGQAELGAVAESEREEGYREGYNKAKFEDEGAVEAAHMREDLMEQRFADDAERFKNTMRKMLNEREEKINRLEKRLIRRGWMDRARVERNGVMRNLNKLNRLLENPTRKQHIPQGLRASTAKLLETIGNTRLPNGKTVFTGRMQQIQADELEKMRNFAHEIQIGLTGAASAENSNRIASTEGFLLQLADKVNALEDYYNRAFGPDVDMSLRTDDVAVTQNYGFLHSLNQILTMAVHALDEANQFTIQGKNYTAENLGALLVGDLNNRESEGYGRQKRKFGTNLSDKLRNMAYETMSADLFFGMMGDNWKNIVAHSYREGQNRQAQHEHQFIEYMRELLGDYDNMKAKRELIQINANGKPLNVTRSQLMQLYATYQRPAGRTHLENGGACFVDDRGNESRAYTIKITPEKFAELTSHLTEEDKRIADGLVKFMADECSEWGNDASMYMYGFRMYEDGSYIPLDVVNYAIPKEIADKIQKTKSIENASFTNPLKRNSTVPLRMTDIFDITNNHVRRMAAYNAYAPITNDMNRIMKLSDVSGTVQEKMGRRGYKYLQDFVQTVAANEVRNGEMTESAAPLTTAMNLYKRQAVAWNVSTMLKQPISIFRAANEIDGKYLRQGFAMNRDEYQRIRNTMLANSGVAYLKDNGYSDVGLGKTMEKLYTKNYINDSGLLRGSLADSKLGRGAITAYDWMTDKGMAGAGRADEATWVRIWKACELEVAEKHPGITADEKLRLVTQRFNDVIGKTQVVDTILDTAPLMRSKAMQIFTPFMNEPTKSLGGLVAAADAVRNGRTGAKKALHKAVGLYALSNLLIEPLITSLVSMWRDEKDDTDGFLWSLLEKMFGIKRDEDGDGKNDTTFGSVFTSNVAKGIFSFPLLNIAYDTISNAIQGFGSEKIDVAALSNLVSSSVALASNMAKEPDERPKTMYRLWGDWIESAAAAMGIPLKTMRRQVAGVLRGVMDITNSDWAKWQYNKLYYNLENGTARSQKNFYDILASAYKRGDTETYERMRKELSDIVTGSSTLVDSKTIVQNIEKRGGNVQPGDPLWNVEVQARFRLDTPVKGWHNENFLTGVYKQAEAAGIKDDECKKVLYSLPDKYEYEDEEGDDIEMSPAEYDQFASDCGDLAYKLVSQLSSSANAKAWSALTIDQQLYAIEKVYDYSKRKFRKDINPDLNISGMGKDLVAVYETAPMDTSKIVSTVMAMAKKYDKKKDRKKK